MTKYFRDVDTSARYLALASLAMYFFIISADYLTRNQSSSLVARAAAVVSAPFALLIPVIIIYVIRSMGSVGGFRKTTWLLLLFWLMAVASVWPIENWITLHSYTRGG